MTSEEKDIILHIITSWTFEDLCQNVIYNLGLKLDKKYTNVNTSTSASRCKDKMRYVNDIMPVVISCWKHHNKEFIDWLHIWCGETENIKRFVTVMNKYYKYEK